MPVGRGKPSLQAIQHDLQANLKTAILIGIHQLAGERHQVGVLVRRLRGEPVAHLRIEAGVLASGGRLMNFSRPVQAIDEMYRVLRDGRTAMIQDMNKDTSDTAIDQEVQRMKLGPLNAFMTRQALVGLRRRAYSKEQFTRMAAASAIGHCEITISGIGMEVRLSKRDRAG